MYSVYTKNRKERRLEILKSQVPYSYMNYRPKGRQSYYEKEVLNGYIDAFINLNRIPILLGGKLL